MASSMVLHCMWQFMKQVYAQENRRRVHNEDQAHLLRHFRMKRMTRQEMIRKRPLRNKRAKGDEKKRRCVRNWYCEVAAVVTVS